MKMASTTSSVLKARSLGWCPGYTCEKTPSNPSRNALLLRRRRFPVHKFGTKPGAGEHPVALRGRQGDAQSGRGLRHGQAAEETQLHQLCAHGVLPGQAGQGLLDRQEIVMVRVQSGWRHLVKIDTPPAA